MSSTSTNTSSPSSSSMTENRSSPQSRRPSRQGVSSPWNQIVRGESEPPIAAVAVPAVPAPSSPQPRAVIDSVSVVPSSPLPVSESVASHVNETGLEKSEESGTRPVWKRPSNGSSSEVGGPVMGASSWPALSETAKVPSNKSSSDSLKSLGDVTSSSSPSSVPVSQGIAHASVPAPRQVSRGNTNPTPNLSRPRSFRRNGTSGSGSNGNVSQPSGQGSFAEMPLHNPSPRGQNQRNGFASQNHGGSDNLSQRESPRNQNGNHHQSHGGRRNHEHGNQNWNFSRSFNGREGNAQSQRGAQGFVRHAPPPPVQPIPPHFMAAQPMSHFGNPVPFSPELASSYYPRMPFIAAPIGPGPVFYQIQDAPLNVKLQKQIQYYFSEENLIRDTYLRGHMDDQGFLPLSVIAGFKKVAELTHSIPIIVDALQNSPYVEVQGDKIRKRVNWQHWLLPRGANLAVPNQVPQPQPAERADTIANLVRNLSLGQSSADPNGGSSSHLQLAEQGNQAAPVSDGQQQHPYGVSNH